MPSRRAIRSCHGLALPHNHTMLIELTHHDLPRMEKVHASAFGPEAWDAKALCEILDMPSSKGFGWVDAGELVSFCLIMTVVDEAEILTIATDKTAQRKGMATQLLTRVIEKLGQENAQSLFLDVANSNQAALQLYTKLGFVAYAERDGYYGEDDALLMRLNPSTWRKEKGNAG